MGRRLHFHLVSGPSCHLFASVPEVRLSKMAGVVEVYFYLPVEPVNWIIKVLSSLFGTPKGNEITGTDRGLERK